MNATQSDGSRQLLAALGWVAAASATCFAIGITAGIAAGVYWAKSSWIASCDTLGWIEYQGDAYECTYWTGEGEEPAFNEAASARHVVRTVEIRS